MRKAFRAARSRRGRTAILALFAATIVFGVSSALANVNGAGFTTDDPATGSPDFHGTCQNGNPGHTTPAVNCNIYLSKKDVWINGGPSNGKNHLTDGTYFFAVLVPGGQPDPNDGAAKNLSDTTCDPYSGCPIPTNASDGSTIPIGDPMTSREFTVSGGKIATYLGGGHMTDDQYNDSSTPPYLGKLINLFPYDDTTNPGGVYILAVCQLSTDQLTAPVTGTADPKDCKYDAFKVRLGECTDNCGPPPAADLFGSKTATPHFTREFNWQITKGVDACQVVNGVGGCDISGTSKTLNYTVTVSHGSGSDSGWNVTGNITVTNPAQGDASNVVVTDKIVGGSDCTVSTDVNHSLDPAGGTLAAGDTALYPYTCTLSAATNGTNRAHVTWNPTLSDGSVTTNSSFDADRAFTFGDPSVVHNCIDVTDTYKGALGTVCVGQDNPKSFTYSRTVTVSTACVMVDNTGSFAAQDTDNDSDDTGSASVTAKVCPELSGSKTATPQFTREYNWQITKGVDACQVVNGVGGCNISGTSKVLNYTVSVSHNTGSDSGWNVIGNITVTNPTDGDASNVKVTDAIVSGPTCTVSTDVNHSLNPAGGTLAAGDTASYPYSCTLSGATNGTNRAHVSWDATLSDGSVTADSSLDADKAFTFGDPSSVIHNCVNVTDTYPSTGTTLGTACVGGAEPNKSFTYQRTVTVPSGCVTVNNSGRFTVQDTDSDSDDTGSASVTAKVCRVPPQTGALTMGFWKNTNGQSLITTYCGGTALRTFLRSYAPFQDLSSTATCAQVASYAAGVFNAATCGGATCNAMLKGQMLATALDVFFTGSGWTSSKIGTVKQPSNFMPHSNLGSVPIDLASICQMIDGSGGTATCSGSYSDVSSAFGGATCLTVSQMLTYAAGQSNIGGSSWYGQVKATQVKAKDAFDAINNVVAFQGSC